MEKMMKKLMMAGIACVALCGTTLAAPAHKPAQGRAPAPVVQKAQRPAPRVAAPVGQPSAGGYPAPQKAHKPAPAPHKAPIAKPMPKPAPQIAHHKAPQHHEAPRRPTTPCNRHRRHECNDCHYDHNGWVEVGAGILGGIIGAIIAG